MIRYRFFGASGFSSRAIEWFSSGYFSHVAAIWSPTELLDSRSDVVGGVPPGVEMRLAKYETAQIMVDMELDCTPAQESNWRAFLIEQLHKPYDKPAILGFAFGRNWQEPDSWFCSELQAAALQECGRSPHLYAPANKINPVCFATIVSALGGQVT